MVHKNAGKPHEAVEVGSQNLIKFIIGQCFQGCKREDRAVVNHNVETTECRNGALHRRITGLTRGKIERDKRSFATHRANFIDHCLPAGLGSGGDQYAGAILGKLRGDHPANSAATAGYQCNLAFKIDLH